MSTHPTRRVSIAGVPVVAVVLAALAFGPTRIDGVRAGAQLPTFSISGDVAGLYPGAQVVIPLTVANPQTFAIDVTSIAGEATSTDRTGCDPAAVSVHGFDGSIVIAAGAEATTTITAEMLPEATDACQGATFTLRYTGSAVKAGLATVMSADPVVAHLGTGGLTLGRLRARLTTTAGDGVVGRDVRFEIDGTETCRDTTDADGVASCDGVGRSVDAVVADGYRAIFDGDTAFQPAEDDAPVLGTTASTRSRER